MRDAGDNIKSSCADWKFNGDVVEKFDEHIKKSVPLYNEGHNLICDISDFFVKEKSVVYEVGSSTGTLTLKLAEHNNKSKPGAKFIGIEIEEDMVKVANRKISKNHKLNIDFVNKNAIEMKLELSDLIVCYYTIQFIDPSVRQALINKLYKSLNWGGALLLFEKTRGSDARFQDIISTLYTDYKIRIGYLPDEILAKSRSLKGVLEPFSTQGNIDMLKRAGFIDIETVQKYICFEGFLAIK
jgi:tRNA (cmo5U34)-methyltransferase